MKSISLLISAVSLISLAGCQHENATPEPRKEEQTASTPEHSTPKSPDHNTVPLTKDTKEATSKSDATALYREAKALMKAGQSEAAYATAKRAMAQFIAEENDRESMLLESITLKRRRVDVHLNMGPDVRNPPDDGIMRPLSFRVWSTDDDEALVETLDFEIGRIEGEPLTAAIGKMEGANHANFGILPIDAPYETIKKAALEAVNRNRGTNE